MFDVVEKYRPIVKVFLGVIALSFVTFGVTQCVTPGEDYIVKVGSTKISKEDISKVIKNAQMDAGNETRHQVFNAIQESTYFDQGLVDLGMGLTDDYVKQQIINIPAFEIDGKFDQATFQQYLNNAHKTELELIKDIKKETFSAINEGLISTNLVLADTQVDLYAKSMLATRGTQFALFEPEQYINDVAKDETKIKAYYEEHKDQYIEPTAVKFSSLVIDPNLIAQQIDITPENIQTYFDVHKDEQAQREVSHILLSFPANADAQVIEQIKPQAQMLLKEVRANPQQFDHFAARFSQDPGSATAGGSLGMVSENSGLVPEFEKVAFSLKNGEISDLVETQFGFHIIKVSSILNRKSLAEDTPAIKALLQLEQAKKGLSEIIENVEEAAFNNPDELDSAKNVAKGLIIEQETQWHTKASLQQNGLSEAFINALFSEEVMEKKHNSDLLTEGPRSFITRIDELKMEQQRSFEDARDNVTNDYTLEEAKKLAKLAADKAIKELQDGQPVALDWSNNIDIDLNTAFEQFSNKDNLKFFMNAKPKDNKPAYMLITDAPAPIIMRINTINYTTDNSDEIKNNIQQMMMPIRTSILKNNYLNYLRDNISLKKGLQKVEE